MCGISHQTAQGRTGLVIQKGNDGMDLSNISTMELVQELSKREGVEKIAVEPYAPYQISTGEKNISDFGPIVLLRVWD